MMGSFTNIAGLTTSLATNQLTLIRNNFSSNDFWYLYCLDKIQKVLILKTWNILVWIITHILHHTQVHNKEISVILILVLSCV